MLLSNTKNSLKKSLLLLTTTPDANLTQNIKWEWQFVSAIQNFIAQTYVNIFSFCVRLPLDSLCCNHCIPRMWFPPALMLPYCPHTPTYGRDRWEACGQSQKASPCLTRCICLAKDRPERVGSYLTGARDLWQRSVCVVEWDSPKPLWGPGLALRRGLPSTWYRGCRGEVTTWGPAQDTTVNSLVASSANFQGCWREAGPHTCCSPRVRATFGSLEPWSHVVSDTRATSNHPITNILSAQSWGKHTVMPAEKIYQLRRTSDGLESQHPPRWRATSCWMYA